MTVVTRLLLGAILAAASSSAQAADPGASAWQANDHAAVRLVSASTSVGSGETLRLGLHFRMKPGWKIYWRSPGDAGYPPRVDWSGSTNLRAAEIAWPAPKRFAAFGLETFGYADEVVLPVEAHPARPGAQASVEAKLDYLVCEQICVPYEAALSLALPAGPAAASETAHLIDRWRARVPGESAAVGIAIERVEWRGGAEPAIEVEARATPAFRAVDVAIEDLPGWGLSRPQVRLSEGGGAAILRLAAWPEAKDAAAPLGATIRVTLSDGDRAVERLAQVAPAPPDTAGAALPVMLLLALLGGLILNLMPCVLPVLSLKLLALVGHGNSPPRRVRLSFLASAAGVVASFLLLAAAAIGLRQAGIAVGWGLQFQQPGFLAFMGVLLVVFAANLFDLFEIRLPATLARGAAAGDGQGLTGAFATGAFAALLATPCSAPFLGTAVGFALSQGPAEILAIFVALGVGLALPYLFIAAWPAAVRLLPRPGSWMVRLRRSLGLALLATALWLASVVAAQISIAAALTLAAVLAALLAVFAWRSAAAANGMRNAATAIGAALVAAAFLLPPRFSAEERESATVATHWVAFDRAAIDAHVRAGRVVLVDVTADWCLTCQVNKRLVLDRGRAAEALASGAVVAMRADWTRPDGRIAQYLASFGRYGIPFNAVYGPGAPNGTPLSEILTEESVLAAFVSAAAPAVAAR